MIKLSGRHVEFYITNVCNYNCENCNRLNNFYFSGHQHWKDYQTTYQEWASKVDIEKITILGGEPLLNPSLIDWIEGIRTLWPNATIILLTNGTRLQFWPNLYEVLLKNNITMCVQLHNRDRYNDYNSYLKDNFYKNVLLNYEYENKNANNWVDSYELVKDISWPDCRSAEDFQNLPEWVKKECTEIHKIDPETFLVNTGSVCITDKNGVTVIVSYSEHFWTSPLKYSGSNKFDIYNSNPTKAHNVCPSKFCYHFIRGKLYKCHHVALLPEFIEQFHVNISDQDLNLLNSYQPLTVDQSTNEMYEFINNLPNEIPQCKLCPESLEYTLIRSSTKKIKIVKRINK